MKSKRISRKEFLKRCTALGLGSAAAVGLFACGPRPTPELVRISLNTATPTATAAATTGVGRPTQTPIPSTSTPTTIPSDTPPPIQPTDTAAAPLATEAPSETPTEAPSPTPPPSDTPGPPPTATATAAPAYLAVARGVDPAENTRRAIAALGGIERFVHNGADVIIKPNICNAYHGPEYASTTNPQVVAALVELCRGAGARRVRVMDLPFGGTPERAYEVSGIGPAVSVAGGEMEVMNRLKYRDVAIPAGRTIQEWPIYGDMLDADVVINVPIAKDHGSTRLTLGLKNQMGVILNRGAYHARGLHQCIADLNTVVSSHLSIVDATRMLMANGPTGGNLNDVRQADTIIASADVVAADAYATTLFDLRPAQIEHIRLGAEMGIGRLDLENLAITEIVS